MTGRAQPRPPLPLLDAGTYWCAVASHADGSALLGIYGPYRTQADTTAAIKRLQDAGVHQYDGVWESRPLRMIELGLEQEGGGDG